jgi:3-hydroxybutyryl-CoA dehydrogenase
VAVIGAGRSGRRFAALFASAGFATALEDILPSNLRKAAEALGGILEHTAGPSLPGKVRLASSVEDAVRTADLIVDCVPDELESKLEIFSLLDRMAPPHAVFVTPTRGLSIADLASCTCRPERCISIEIPDWDELPGRRLALISTSQTSVEVLEAVVGFWEKSGFAVESKIDPSEASVVAGTLF